MTVKIEERKMRKRKSNSFVEMFLYVLYTHMSYVLNHLEYVCYLGIKYFSKCFFFRNIL